MDKRNENYLKVILGLFSMTLMIYIGTTLFKKARVDFTEESLYTLSDGTKSILSKLDSPIKLKLYYSKTAANKGTEGLRAFNNHYLYVQELLRQYVSNSRNNLTLDVIDPRPDTPEEEDAQASGLKKFNLTETERYFFGLVAENESGTEKIIEFFDPNQKDKLEYDLTKLIYMVLNPQKKNIGIISSMEVMTENLNPYMAQIMRMQGKSVSESWVVTKMLSEFYNVKKIEKDTKAITGLDLLVVIHPKGFSEETLFAIDQYVMKGGNLLVFVDPNAVSDRSAGMYGGTSSSPDAGFKKLMDKWGVELKANTYAGDKYLSGVGRFNPNMPAGRLLALLNCNENCTNEYKDNVTSGINNSTFVFPGVLEKKETEGIKHTPIMSTTAKGNSYTAMGYELNNPQALWNKFSEGTKPVVIAYKVLGKYKTAFPDGVKITEPKEDKKKGSKAKKSSSKKDHKTKVEVVKESTKESAVIIFSDVDFINDQFAFKNTFLGMAAANDNSTLFLNSVEALTGDVDLMSVRSKGRVNRSFDVINQIEFEAEKRTADKVKEINASIARFQAELNQLGKKANEGNIALLQNEGIRKKKELAKKIAVLKKELRAVKREGREKVEGIGKFFQYLNTLFVPFFVIVFGVYYNRKRSRLMQGGRINKKSDDNTKQSTRLNNFEEVNA
ncbi:MAG: Gldg family protein [Bdellovibrionota bacterium]|nr:Gldg family protein [Bdellovibrionota bacterium]